MAKKKGTKRPTYDEPVGVIGTVDELPPREYESQSKQLIQQIQEADGKWVELDPKGRQAGSVQSMISSAASRMDLDISVSTRGDRVFAKMN